MSTLLDTARLEIQLRSHRIQVLPIVAVCVNNVCDSRCGTCAIWKNNQMLTVPGERQMSDSLLAEIYESIRTWRARQVMLSGGEPAIHPRFPEIVSSFARIPSAVSVVSNGLALNTYGEKELRAVQEFYLSFDAPDRNTYEKIRGVDGFGRLATTLELLNRLVPRPKIIARCTLQRLNVRRVKDLIAAARRFGFDSISFLGLDMVSEAFSRPVHGIPDESIQPTSQDLLIMAEDINSLSQEDERFVDGGRTKLQSLLQHCRALIGEASFPVARCNAPWVSVVIETTGLIRGCFFQPIIGDFRNVNGEKAFTFRRSLNVATDVTCQRCVGRKFVGAREFMQM